MNLHIRKFQEQDKSVYFEFSKKFYHPPAVLHAIDESNFHITFSEIINGSPYAEGYMLFDGETPIGYGLLSKTYSNEVGGMVVWLEELYITEEYRGSGVGTAYFRFIEEQYRGKCKRLRLEVSKENPNAIRLYRRLGYDFLDYLQMVVE